jgi:putative chitinase
LEEKLMSIEKAIKVCASSSVTKEEAFSAWDANAGKLRALGINNARREASLIGQSAHESMKFRTRFENLNYSGAGLWKVFRRHFASKAEANSFAGQPERIANRVYSNRNGNGSEASGDGWRYRGRGYIQLTGRRNYRLYGELLDIDLVAHPERAAETALCWLVAAQYMARTRRSGRTLLQWADVPDILMVTKGINGGTNGLQDRKVLTARAYRALTGEKTVAEWQVLLLNAGFDPGPVDGLWGPKTEAAKASAEAKFGLTGDALFDHLGTIT